VLFGGFVESAASQQPPAPAGWSTYADPRGRFHFSYPAAFGESSRGSNDGFADRVAAVRFAAFSSGLRNGRIVLGGEAVLTRGFVLVDVQTLGGLYDSIALEVFPDPLRAMILANLPMLTPASLCSELPRARHADLQSLAFASLTQPQKDAIASMDAMRNIDPRVVRCEAVGDTITFLKETTFESGREKGRQNVYGAIRFLKPPFSSFQLIRATQEAPTPEMLATMGAVVDSFRQGSDGQNPISKNP
jgi:hypothetical protein